MQGTTLCWFSSSSPWPAMDPPAGGGTLLGGDCARRQLRGGRAAAPPRPRSRRPRSRVPASVAQCRAVPGSRLRARAPGALLRGPVLGRRWVMCLPPRSPVAWVDCTPVRGRRNRSWRSLRNAACKPSGGGGTVNGSDGSRPPLATAEFLVVDTETNGLGGERCEVTEIGAVLVGGGELHERWETLVPCATPLSRGIQRFTGITQAMVDEAPPAEVDAARAGRAAARAASSSPTTRRSTAACCARRSRARASTWPDPPALCTVALARRLAPARAPAQAAPARRVAGDRGRGRRTARWPTPRRARACSARCSRGCARTRRRSARRCALLRPRAPRAGARRGGTDGGRSLPGARRRRSTARRCPTSRASTSSATPRASRCTSASRSTLRSRARAHFAPSSPRRRAGSRRPRSSTTETTHSELGALLLEHRLIRELRPPGNVRLKHEDRYVYLRCRLDIAFPVLEVAPEPAAGHAVNVGPLRGRVAARRARRAAQLAVRAAPLRPRAAAARAPVGLRADGPLPVAVPGRPRPERLPPAARRGARAVHRRAATAARALLAHVDAQMRAAARRAALRARRLAAAPARAARGAAARASTARWPRRTRARGSCSPPHPRGGAVRRVLAGRRPRRRLGRR